MSNAFYNASGAPTTGSPGASATIRSEFAAIAAGFDKLPATFTPNYLVVVNAGGTALTATNTPNLGTPSAGVLTNCTGLPLSSVAGLGTGIATFLATPSSANLAAAVSDETGTGALVFGTNPVLTTPNIGVPSAGTLTNCTGLPIAGITGLGTGVATLLAGTSSGTGGLAGTVSPTFTGTVGAAAVTATGNITGTSLIPSGSTIPTNGIYLPAANRVGIAANSTNVVNVTTSGLGIGMTPTNILDITQTQNAESAISLLNANTSTGGAAAVVVRNSTHGGYLRIHSTGFTTANSNRADGLVLGTDGAGGISFSIPSDAYRFYFGASAQLQITNTLLNFAGTSGVSASHGTFVGSVGGGTVTCTGFGVQSQLDIDGSIVTTSGNGLRMVCVSAGVVLNNGASSWAAISDYRAKNISGEFSSSGEIIDAVPVYLGALKDKPEVTKAMFLAHEIQAVVPYAVHGEKDGEKMQTVETTDPLVPVLWAEIRSLRAERRMILERIEALEALQ